MASRGHRKQFPYVDGFFQLTRRALKKKKRKKEQKEEQGRTKSVMRVYSRRQRSIDSKFPLVLVRRRRGVALSSRPAPGSLIFSLRKTQSRTMVQQGDKPRRRFVPSPPRERPSDCKFSPPNW